MKRFLPLVLSILFITPAWAADVTQLTAGSALTNTLFYGAQVGAVPINRNFKLNSTLFPLTGNTIGLAVPWTVAQGGTGLTSASGTALDAITGFNGLGILRRNGAGSYTFMAAPSGIIVGHNDPIALENKVIDCLLNTCSNFPGGGGGGGVTSLATGAGLTGGTITGTGTIAVLAHGITPALMEQRAANTVLGVAGASTADVAGMVIPDCPDSNGGHLNKASGAAFSCGTTTSQTPTVFIGGPTTHSTNDYTLAGVSPTNFSLINGATVRTVFDNDNTAASRINVAGSGLTSIQLNTSGGFTPLKGGELQNGLISDLVYNSTCTCWVLMNVPAASTVSNFTTRSITAKEFDTGTIFIAPTAAQTMTFPVSTGLSPNGGSLISTPAGALTITSTAPDVIVCGTTTTAAGASITLPQGTLGFVGTDGAGHITVAPGTCNSGVLVASVLAGGTGQTTYTNGQLLIGNTATGGLSKATLTAGANVTITNGNGTITVASSGGGGGGTNITAPQGRFTCTSGKPVMTADVTSCTTIYYDNYIGNAYPYWDGAADNSAAITAGEISDALPNAGAGVVNASDLFDEWLINGFVCHATDGAGLGWSGASGFTNLQTRPNGYAQLDLTTRPYITNANIITHCYSGAVDKGPIAANQATYGALFYATAAGTTKMQFTAAAANGGSNAFLGLGNAYNGVAYISRSIDNTGTASTYSTATWRPMRNSTSNRITAVDPLGRYSVSLQGDVNFNGFAGGNCTYAAAFNRNSTSATPGTNVAIYTATAGSTVFSLTPYANFPPAVGLSYYQMMEDAPSATSCDSGGSPTIAMTVNGM